VRFTLTYDGPLHISGNAQGKQDVREQLHPQLRALWQYPPLDGAHDMLTWQGLGPTEPGHRGISVLTEVKGQVYAPLVCKSLG
jgi:hypothetical protein